MHKGTDVARSATFNQVTRSQVRIFTGSACGLFCFSEMDQEGRIYKPMQTAKKIDIEDITIYKNELQAVVEMYCDDNNIDESNIYPTVWNDILTEIYEQIYLKDIELLHDIPNYSNQYNYDKVLKAYYIYKRLCNNHSQEISQKGFLTMTGIDKQTIYNWSSSGAFDLHEKMQEDNQESLEKLMFDRRNNPMKYLPKLNRYHGYNMSGVRENKEVKAVLSAAELPQLNKQKVVELPPVNNAKS